MSFSMGTQIHFLREDISLLAQNSFQFHIIPLRLHIDWNILHFPGQLQFLYSVCMTLPKLVFFICEMYNEACWRHTVVMVHRITYIFHALNLFLKNRKILWIMLVALLHYTLFFYSIELLHDSLQISYSFFSRNQATCVATGQPLKGN